MSNQRRIDIRYEQIQIAYESLNRRFGHHKRYKATLTFVRSSIYLHCFFFAAKDENIRKIMREIEHLTDDCNKLQQILEVVISLR